MNELSILIVEDELILSEIMADVLEHFCRKRPLCVTSGSSALIAMDTFEPDIILMDIKIRGDIDGIETARKIHEKEWIPLVFMTAYTDPEIREQADKIEHCGFLSKPIDFKMLEELIERIRQRKCPEKQNRQPG